MISIRDLLSTFHLPTATFLLTLPQSPLADLNLGKIHFTVWRRILAQPALEILSNQTYRTTLFCHCLVSGRRFLPAHHLISACSVVSAPPSNFEMLYSLIFACCVAHLP